MDSRLQGRRAFVTGGSRGIGAAIARRLAREGADVAFTYVSKPAQAEGTVKEIERLGRRGWPCRRTAPTAGSRRDRLRRQGARPASEG